MLDGLLGNLDGSAQYSLRALERVLFNGFRKLL